MSLIVLWLCACTPAQDWREITPVGLGITALFPCRPAIQSRDILIAAQPVNMVLLACATGGTTFALSSARIGDIRALGDALQALSAAAATKLGAALVVGDPLQLQGMTPNQHARSFRLTGQLADGTGMVEHLWVFARGDRIYQAIVLGEQPNADAVQAFFAGLKLST